MKIQYKLTRLEDIDGQVNWKITPMTDAYIHVRWDYAKIREDAKSLKVGESKIFEV
jgi:hypothetical protein